MASGAWSFLKEALQHLPPSQAFEQAIDIFDFASLMCVCVQPGNEQCIVWSKEISELIPPSESAVSASLLLMAPQMVMQQRQCRFRVGDSLVIHTYTEEIAAKIEIYFQRFRHLSPSEFLSELAVFLGTGSEGAVLFLKNRGSFM